MSSTGEARGARSVSRLAPMDVHTWTPGALAHGMDDYFSGAPLRVGLGTQLLAHSALIEDRRGVTRRVTPPERYGAPILRAEHPWENRAVFRPTVYADANSGRLRMWYGTLPPVLEYMSRKLDNIYSLLYAESDDGLNWDKPRLDLVADTVHGQTNVIYRGGNNNCSAYEIIIDPQEADPTRRYKMIHKGGRDPAGISAEELAFSPDGLSWRPYAGNPVMPHRHDCDLNLLFDTTRSMWTAYVRPYAFGSGIWPGQQPVHHRRRVAIAESADLIEWSNVRTVLAPMEGDPNEFDNISVFPHGNTLVGIVGVFEENELHEQRQHSEIALSVDGRRWERIPGAAAYVLPTGSGNDFDRDSLGLSTAALVDDQAGELLLFYNGSRWEAGRFTGDTAIGLLRAKRDRFVEQYAAEEGWLLTRELVLEGNSLAVNCRVNQAHGANGRLAVELAEYPGQAIPGFTLEDCDPITGDHAEHTVTWGGRADLASLRGRPLYLRFQLRDAGLWSFSLRA